MPAPVAAYLTVSFAFALSAAAQPSDWVEFDGHLYKLTSTEMSWLDAEAEANAEDGYLVAIGSQGEHQFLIDTFLVGALDATSVWIGATDSAVEGEWVWSNGEPLIYTNWHPGEPNDSFGGEDYACMNWWRELSAGTEPKGDWNDCDNLGTPVSNPPLGPFLGIIEKSAGFLETKLLASDRAERDYFGSAVALDGDTAIVSARATDDILQDSGSVYVFVHVESGWTEQAELKSNAPSQSNFGGRRESLSISGDTALVGDCVCGGGNQSPKGAHVYVRNGSSWSHQTKLTPGSGSSLDYFGEALEISGETALVAAPGDDQGGLDAGAAYVFTRDGASWSEQQKLMASDAAASSYFGATVDLDGDTAIVGAESDSFGGSGVGGAYVFQRDAGTWTQQAKLAIDEPVLGGTIDDYPARSVAIEGDTAVVGVDAAAYVFTRSGSVWSQQASLVPADWDPDALYGLDVGISGDWVVVSARYADSDLGLSKGAVYVFVQHGPSWTELEKLTRSDGLTTYFPDSIAISGERVLAGDQDDNEGGLLWAGAAYLWEPATPLGPSFALSLSGTCPGTVQLQIEGGTPLGDVALGWAVGPGSATVPAGPCAGTEVGLASPQLLTVLPLDADGSSALAPTVPLQACGLYLQGLDLTTCEPTNVEQVPVGD